MARQIHVIGLGPGSPEHLTTGALTALQSGAPVFLRTGIHPTVAALDQTGVRYRTFDSVYERAGALAAVYETIAASLLDAAQNADIVFAVPGHPLIGEETVRLLLSAAPSRGVTVKVEPAVSFHAGDPATQQAAIAFARLVDVMATLRGPSGCPWDQEQTHRSLRPYLLEEAYEVLEAIAQDDAQQMQEELGDVLLQVVFHGEMARGSGTFTLAGVIDGLTAKLIRRHPHVFGDTQVSGASDVVRNWEAIKALEKGKEYPATVAPTPESLLAGISRAMPALLRASKLQKRAAKVGFDWPDVSGAMEKLDEELRELKEVAHPGTARAEEELGDLLFAAVNVARFLRVDPEVALTNTNAKFMRRFEWIESEAGRLGHHLATMSLSEMDDLWNRAKEAE